MGLFDKLKAVTGDATADAKAINAKAKTVKEYNDAVNKPPAAMDAIPYGDKINPGASGKYGSRPGELTPAQIESAAANWAPKTKGKAKRTGF